MIETSLWLLATAMAWQWSKGSYFFTIPFGTSMGIVVVLLSTILGWGKAISWSSRSLKSTTNSQPSQSSPGSTFVAQQQQQQQNNNKKKNNKKNNRKNDTIQDHKHQQNQNPPISATPTKSRRTTTTTYEWSQVAAHSTMQDCWIVIHGIVYDVTTWGPKHPGGSIIYKYGGKDCSDQFEAFHRPHVKTRLTAYKIGSMSVQAQEELLQTTSQVTLAYRALRTKLWANGHFNADPVYFYYKHCVWLGLMLTSAAMVYCHHRASGAMAFTTAATAATAATATTATTSTWSTWQISVVAGCLLGLGWQQAAFVAHDAAHNGINPPTKGGGLNWLGWFLGSPVFGISASLWTEEHNAHHAITLRPLEDPQFNYLPFWMISEKELTVEVPQGWSGQIGTFQMNRCFQFLISIQHWTFLPLSVLIGRFNFYVISFVFAFKQLIKGPTQLHRIRSVLDLVGMMMYWYWFVALTSMFEATHHRVFFVLASHWTVGILHVQLLLSHLATTTFTAAEEEKIGFFSFQLGTSRNIEVYTYEHWFHGGLEYQIEHHLFPQLPRHQLDVVKPMVEQICREHNIEYRSIGFMAAMHDVLSDLKRLATDIVTLEMG